MSAKRRRPSDDDETKGIDVTAPVFEWSGGSRSMLSARQAQLGSSIVLPNLAVSHDDASHPEGAALRSIITASSTPHAAFTYAESIYAVKRNVWLPPALSGPSIQLVFPGVGLGNRLFLYTLSRSAAFLLGREFVLLTPHPLFTGIEASVPKFEGEVCATAATVDGVATREWTVRDVREASSSRGASRESNSLALFLSLSSRIGSVWVTSQPSCGAAGAFVRDAATFAAAWFTPLMVRCLAASLKSVRDVGAGVDDWVVHVREGDIWRSATQGASKSSGGAGGVVNSAYCPPPVSWYRKMAADLGIRRVWLVSGTPDGELTQAVATALKAGGAQTVCVTRGDESADFGTLLRARNVIVSCSTFAWWASVLAPFRPSVYARTLAGLAQRSIGGPEASKDIRESSDFESSLDRTVRVCVPLTGMLRPESVHAIHADLSLASHGPRSWYDSTALDADGAPKGARTVSSSARIDYFKVWTETEAAAMDSYSCSPAQRSAILGLADRA